MSGRPTPLIILAASLILIAGCASATKRGPPREIRPESPRVAVPKAIPEQCAHFCKEIRETAARYGHEDLGDQLCAIALCETGKKCSPRLDSPGRRYRGAFQFSRRTWRGLCYPVFERLSLSACRSTRAMHDLSCATACSAELISQGGIGNWPVCGRD